MLILELKFSLWYTFVFNMIQASQKKNSTILNTHPNPQKHTDTVNYCDPRQPRKCIPLA